MKSITPLLLLSILLLALHSCKQTKPTVLGIEQQIIGKWNVYDHPERRFDVEFLENGNYNYYFNDVLETSINWNSVLYDQLVYKIEKEGGENKLLIYGKGSEKLLIKYLIEYYNEGLYIVSYKMKKGIDHHIDEFSRWERVGETTTEAPVENKPQIEIVFPKDFSGLALIAFEDAYGTSSLQDNHQVVALTVPSNGMLRTRTIPMPLAFAKKEVTYLLENENGEFEQLELVSGNRNTGEFKSKNLDPDKIYLMNYGFNQIDRTRVNHKLFKSEVKNDVLFLAIGKPDELATVWLDMIESIQW